MRFSALQSPPWNRRTRMKIAITILALAEISVLLASVAALLFFAARKLVRMVRGSEDDVAFVPPLGAPLAAPSHKTYTRLVGAEPVKTWLRQLGVHVSDAEAREITAAVRLHSLKTKSIPSHAELRDLANGVINKAAA